MNSVSIRGASNIDIRLTSFSKRHMPNCEDNCDTDSYRNYVAQRDSNHVRRLEANGLFDVINHGAVECVLERFSAELADNFSKPKTRKPLRVCFEIHEHRARRRSMSIAAAA